MPRRRRHPSLRWAVVLLLTLTATLAGSSSAVAQGGVGHVDVPVDDPSWRTLSAYWPGVVDSPDFVVSRATETVQILLPPEVDDIGLDDVGAKAWVLRDDDNLPMTSVDLTDDVVTVPLAAYLAAQAPIVPSTLDVVVKPDGADYSVYLVVRLTLTSDLGPSDVTFDLSLDDARDVSDRYGYEFDGLIAGAGTRITVDAEPGFWNEPGTTAIDVSTQYALDNRVDEWGQLQYTVSADGSRLTFTLPDADVEYRNFGINLSVNGLLRRTVGVYLVPPLSDPVEAYVESVYLDLFGRGPDPTGLTGWSRALTSGTPYGAVADGITYSREFRQGLITDAYDTYLGRGPDPVGLQQWTDAMGAGLHIQQMESGFIASPEYYSRAGGTDASWIAAVYQDVLGRPAAASEVQTWLPAVRASGRVAVARSFLYSTEHLTTVVDGYYQWLLGRGIDPAGGHSWVVAIQGGARTEQIIAGIIASNEYRGNVPSGEG